MRKKVRISDTGGNISETEMTSDLVRYFIVAAGLFPAKVKGAANTVIHWILQKKYSRLEAKSVVIMVRDQAVRAATATLTIRMATFVVIMVRDQAMRAATATLTILTATFVATRARGRETPVVTEWPSTVRRTTAAMACRYSMASARGRLQPSAWIPRKRPTAAYPHRIRRILAEPRIPMPG